MSLFAYLIGVVAFGLVVGGIIALVLVIRDLDL